MVIRRLGVVTSITHQVEDTRQEDVPSEVAHWKPYSLHIAFQKWHSLFAFWAVSTIHIPIMTLKEVILHAAGLSYSGMEDRHVLLQWENGTDKTDPVMRVVQLTGQAGNYAYYLPVAKHHPPDNYISNQIFSLRGFSRAQRDQILDLRRQVVFSKTSTTNGCRVWTRDLLMAMVRADLISQAKFDKIDAGVPLVKRVAEA